MPKIKLFSFLALLMLSGCTSQTSAPVSPTAPTLELLQSATLNFPEGSGIIYHPGRETFFVISDKGNILELKKDLSVIRNIKPEASNFEGLTLNPATGLLYAVIEGRDRIVEINPENIKIIREFSVNRKFEKNRVLFGGKEGFEGIAFVPDTNNPQGGTFFVTNQVTHPTNKKDSSALIEILLPLTTSGSNDKKPLQGTIVEVYPIEYTDLSDIFYDSHDDEFLVLSDSADKILKVNRHGEILWARHISGVNQEGVTLDSERNIIIVEDRPTTTPFYRYQTME